METSEKHLRRRWPTVGMRTMKTAIAATLCAFVYYFLNRSPAFACIGAIFGMGGDLEDSKWNGGNRLFGTIIGGLLGMGLFRIYLLAYPDGGHHSLLLTALVFVGVLLLIVLCQTFWLGGVQPGGVVLCIVLFNTPADTYVSYALNRILDTGVGVVAAMAVNALLPGGMAFRRFKKEAAALEKEIAEVVESGSALRPE